MGYKREENSADKANSPTEVLREKLDTVLLDSVRGQVLNEKDQHLDEIDDHQQRGESGNKQHFFDAFEGH